jgi:hypothetical protein
MVRRFKDKVAHGTGGNSGTEPVIDGEMLQL